MRIYWGFTGNSTVDLRLLINQDERHLQLIDGLQLAGVLLQPPDLLLELFLPALISSLHHGRVDLFLLFQRLRVEYGRGVDCSGRTQDRAIHTGRVWSENPGAESGRRVFVNL